MLSVYKQCEIGWKVLIIVKTFAHVKEYDIVCYVKTYIVNAFKMM